MKKLNCVLLLMVFSLLLSAQEIPLQISYQGKLLENGIPVTGTKNITFTIDSWSETKSVSVNDGLYSVTLGETTPIPISIFNSFGQSVFTSRVQSENESIDISRYGQGFILLKSRI